MKKIRNRILTLLLAAVMALTLGVGAVPALAEEEIALTDFTDGEYIVPAANFSFVRTDGTTGKAKLTAEKIIIQDGQITGVFTASSANFTHVYYGGHTESETDDPAYYDPVTGAMGEQVLEIIDKSVSFPVVLNEDVNIACRTTAMSDPHWVNYIYRITFDEADYELADYTEVDAALATVPTDLSIYTDASVQAVTDAVNAVVRDKKAYEQAEVNAMAAAIYAAVEALEEKPSEGQEEGVLNLSIINQTKMFKAVSASLVTTDGQTELVVALSSDGYHELFKGTYEQAVANGDGSEENGNGSWIHGYQNDAGMWEFRIPLEEGETYVPVVAVSNSYYEKYLNGEASLDRAFYPRQMEVDAAEATLVTGDYDYVQPLALTNNVSRFSVSGAELQTLGGPNSNNYRQNIILTMGSTSFDKAYVGTASEAAAAEEVITIGEEKTAVIKVKWIEIPGQPETTQTLIGDAFTISFHSVSKDAWYERIFTVNDEDMSLVIDPAADYSAVDAALAAVPADLSIYTQETAQAVTDAVNAVVRHKKASDQEEVDLMAAAIEAAVAGLVERPADYSAVDAAMATVPTDLTIYTEASAGAVTAAVTAVIRGKMAGDQAAVDAMAAAIEAAVKALKVDKFAYDGDTVQFIKRDGEAFGMWSALGGSTFFLNGDKVEISIIPSNSKKTYSWMHWGGINEELTKDETLAEDGRIVLSVDKANCGWALPVAPIKTKDDTATTSSQYYLAIPTAEKLADYTAVFAALAKVPEDLSIYTEETAAAVSAAVEAVDYTKAATEQAEIEAMAKAIEDAVAGLVKKVTAIKLNKTYAEVATKATLQLKVTFKPSDTTQTGITWKSSDTSIATVDKNGKVTAKIYGKPVTITATSTANKNLKATCKVQTRFSDATKQNVDTEMFKAIYWFADKKITGNTTTFGTKDSMSRGQFVTFLWRLAGKPKAKTTKNPFADVTSKYAHYKGIMWAVGEGIINGYTENGKQVFKPEDKLTRNQVATMLWKLAGSKKVKNPKNPFADVKNSTAIKWGKQQGIFKAVEGTNNKFLPKKPCTRGDFAVFMYRYYN